MRIIRVSLLGIVAGSLPLLAQGAGSILGGGYTLPTLMKVAPGQVITLLAPSVGESLTEVVVADEAPLPTSLGGISVSLRQSAGETPVAVPIFAVSPLNTCPAGLQLACTGDTFTAITVQIPYELTSNSPGGTIFEGSETVLTVAENGVAGSDFRVNPVLDQIHVLNSCDVAMAPLGYVSEGCQPIVVHADGSLATPSNPALSEEVLVVYAFGLGSPVSSVETGHPTPSPISAPNTARRV